MELRTLEQAAKEVRTHGYARLLPVLAPAELDRLREQVYGELSLCRWRGSVGCRRKWVPLLAVPEVQALLLRPEFKLFAEGIVNRPVFGVMADGNEVEGSAEPHSDALRYELSGVRLNLYFDTQVRGKGALTVIPGSHERHRWLQLDRLTAETDVTASCLEVPAGGLVAMDLRTWHFVKSDETSRKFLSMFFYATPATAAELLAVQESAARNRRAMQIFFLPRDKAYPQAVLNALPQEWKRELENHGFVDHGLAAHYPGKG